jgi:hypothetical protein
MDNAGVLRRMAERREQNVADTVCRSGPDQAWVARMQEEAEALRAALADMERMDWLDKQCEAYGTGCDHEGNQWTVEGAYSNVRRAIDSEQAYCELAARASSAGEGE